MLHIGSANYRLRQRDFVKKYATSNDIPLQERSYFVQLGQNIEIWGSPGFVDTPKGKGIIPWEVCHGGRTKEVHEGIQG